MKRLIPLVLLVVLSTRLFSQKNIPSWVLFQKTEEVIIKDTGNVSNGYYYVLLDEQHNTVLNENFFHYAQKVISESGLSIVSQIETSYDPEYESLQFNMLRIIRNGRIINKLDMSKFRVLNEENERYEGILTRQKTLYRNLEDVRTGDIVEYAYTRKGCNPIFNKIHSYDFVLNSSEPAGKIYYRAIFSKNEQPKIYTYNTNFTAESIQENGMIEYIWRLKNPAPLIIEESYPSWFNPYPHVTLTNYENWEHFKKESYRIVLSNAAKNSKVQEVVKNIKAQCGDDSKKQLTMGIDFVQNKVRYSGSEHGIYSHTAHSPNEVLENMYGDCKDKSLLLCEIFKQLGREAYPALISTVYKHQVANMPPSHIWFDHCIVALKAKDGEYQFIDPTITLQGGSYEERKAPFFEKAVVLDKSDTVFTDVPANNSSCEITEIFTINSLTKAAILTVTTVAKGDRADNLRYYLKDNSLDKVQVSYKDYYARYSKKIEVVDTLSYVDDIENNIITVKEKYRLPHFWEPVSESRVNNVEKDFTPYIINDDVVYGDPETKKYPLSLVYPANNAQTIKIVCSGGWSAPDTYFNLENNHFIYNYTTRTKRDTLILHYTFNALKKYVMPEEYKEYKQQTDKLSYNMIFTSLVENTKTASGKFNYIYLVAFICTIGITVYIVLHVSKIRITTPYEKRYEHIGGWLVIVAINMVLSPVLLLISVITNTIEVMGEDYYTLYFSKSSSLKDYFLGAGETFFQVSNIFLLGFHIFLTIQFFKHKSNFRRLYVIFKSAQVLFLLLNVIYMWICFPGLDTLIHKQTLVVIQVGINFAIWGSYLWFSERSRHTFTVGNPDSFRDPISGNDVL